MNYAQALDDSYRAATNLGAQGIVDVAKQLVRVDDSAVCDLDWDFVQRCEKIKNDSLNGALPATYTAASRLPQTAMRLAAVLAVIDNPMSPTVTGAHYKWAFGYCLQNTVNLLRDMDLGEVGDEMENEVSTIRRVWREMVKDGAMDGKPGILRSDFVNKLCNNKPFRNSRQGRYGAATQCVQQMVRNEQLQEITVAAAGRGRPATYVLLV